MSHHEYFYVRQPDPLFAFEAPYLTQLRTICEAIGYGRTIQVVERWWDLKKPGTLAANHARIARQHRASKKGARVGRRTTP